MRPGRHVSLASVGHEPCNSVSRATAITATAHAAPVTTPPMTSVSQRAPRQARERPTAHATVTATTVVHTCILHERRRPTRKAVTMHIATATVTRRDGNAEPSNPASAAGGRVRCVSALTAWERTTAPTMAMTWVTSAGRRVPRAATGTTAAASSMPGTEPSRLTSSITVVSHDVRWAAKNCSTGRSRRATPPTPTTASNSSSSDQAPMPTSTRATVASPKVAAAPPTRQAPLTRATPTRTRRGTPTGRRGRR